MTKPRAIVAWVRRKAMEAWDIWLQIVAYVTTLITLAIGGTWALSRQSSKLEAALREEHERFRHDIAESLSAIRQKVTQVELWSRDEFVRREDYHRSMDGINASIKSLSDKIDSRTDRLEDLLRHPRPATG